ncbi:hypothetical protein AYI68_g37 [Smittium mucronatum]|uniref:Uncharacterized protein n=1 Tax=Smittium mucronatum TaxID=133383 RepID=A0A1R0H9G8_9FUNG|nr:hypothetical protein AYI68_g37 [Smittium mucronatum]
MSPEIFSLVIIINYCLNKDIELSAWNLPFNTSKEELEKKWGLVKECDLNEYLLYSPIFTSISCGGQRPDQDEHTDDEKSSSEQTDVQMEDSSSLTFENLELETPGDLEVEKELQINADGSEFVYTSPINAEDNNDSLTGNDSSNGSPHGGVELESTEVSNLTLNKGTEPYNHIAAQGEQYERPIIASLDLILANDNINAFDAEATRRLLDASLLQIIKFMESDLEGIPL